MPERLHNSKKSSNFASEIGLNVHSNIHIAVVAHLFEMYQALTK